MKKYNLATINANLDNMLIEAQELLENTINAYGVAVDYYSECMVDYRKGKEDAVRKLKNANTPIGIIRELSGGMTASLKGEMIKAEGNMKRLKMLVDAYTERINGMKFIGKRIDTLAQK